MIIKFKGEYKSLGDFESEILNPFSVITGKNGCGKSQLVELIDKKVNKQLDALCTLTFKPKMDRIQIGGIANSNLSALTNSNWLQSIDDHLNNFKHLRKNTKLLGELLIENDIWPTEYNSSPEFPEEILFIGNDLIRNSFNEISSSRVGDKMSIPHIIDELWRHSVFSESKRKGFVLAKFVSKFRNKKISDLIENDFYLSPIPDYLLEEPKLFGSLLEFAFYNYAKRRDLNDRLFFHKEKYGDNNDAVSDIEFINTNIPPWDFINKILQENNLSFKFKGIERQDFSPDANISFQLIKTTTGKDIELQNLSSGEKVIIGLIIKLFTSSYYNDKLQFPELIVLDEPDAHLHPEMSKLLLDVLNKTFVQELNIRVIMITHSPSTIALCPDDSIYQLKNEPVTSLQKIEKNDALELLTNFIPTLSIDYKNHKQIFVESPTDVYYYQTIFNKLNQKRSYPFRLYFISNSYGKGNCNQVIKIVKDIRESGNSTSFGIIDWDLKNTSSSFVKVHGLDQRYSLENYLYDPIYLLILLMDLDAHNIYNELGLDKTINHFLLGNESGETLQRISDWFFKKYYDAQPIDKSMRSGLTEVEYLNGAKINTPTWFLKFKGHDLEMRIRKVFPALDKYTSEGELQEELTNIIGKCYPFIPKDSELLIEEIIMAKNPS